MQAFRLMTLDVKGTNGSTLFMTYTVTLFTIAIRQVTVCGVSVNHTYPLTYAVVVNSIIYLFRPLEATQKCSFLC